MTAWFALLLAGLLEVGWALGLKYSDGFTRFWPSVATLAAILLSFGLLGMSLKSVPFGTAYAVWTGIGAVGTIALGIVIFGEAASPFRLACLATRVRQFHQNTLSALGELVSAAGLSNPGHLQPAHILKRISPSEVRSFAEVYTFLAPRELLTSSAHPFYAEQWAMADAHAFAPLSQMQSAA